MTKLRAPLSIEQALARIAGQLADGYDSMAKVTGRSASLVRKWGDPDRDEDITLRCAIDLDLAYIAAGGQGHPLFDAYSAKLEMAEASTFADRFGLLRHAQEVIREGGEAHAAMIAAALPSATKRDREIAARELSEAYEALKPAMAAFGAAEPHQTGPPG